MKLKNNKKENQTKNSNFWETLPYYRTLKMDSNAGFIAVSKLFKPFTK